MLVSERFYLNVSSSFLEFEITLHSGPASFGVICFAFEFSFSSVRKATSVSCDYICRFGGRKLHQHPVGVLMCKILS